MSEHDFILGELIGLSRELGREERQLVILGEGNTSADCGDGTFWIKASGSQLGKIDASGFSRVRFASVLELLAAGPLRDTQVAEGLHRALADGSHRQPSVETFLHALCLTDGGAKWVAHTHPVAVNQFLCSQLGVEPFLRHIYPDAIVLCGKVPAVIPYIDPGHALAEAARDTLRDYQELHGYPPKLLLMVNHGMVALGQTAQEVFNISLMADKWARVLLGSYALGGPRYMSENEVDRIDHRLDEHYRRSQLSK
ncbi:MAG TPA: class II aldolase/adducin family protein [Anaerolineales bacterium]|nr:class II aldolase/adducin family protein [Anaerolineales bacterium]